MQLWQCMHYPHNQGLRNETANDEVKRVWYADDSSAVGSLAGVKMVGMPTGQETRLWVLP